MAVSKRLRFEILRRDNHTCRYCGRSAPEVRLTVDHVIAVALGGNDAPENLVAACADCNAGKSSVPAGAPLVADVAADALRWAAAMALAAQGDAVVRMERDQLRELFLDTWHDVTGYGFNNKYAAPLPADWVDTVDSMLKGGLEIDDLLEAARIAGRKTHVSSDSKFKYFCGVCWTMRTERLDTARAILEVQQERGAFDA